MKRSQLLKGDVLFNIVGASIGRACVFDQEVDANINQAIAIIRPDKFKILSSYLCYILNSEVFQNYFSKEKSGGARDNIDLYQLRNTPINIPPLSIQAELVELMDTAYNLKKAKETEAKKILEGINDYVMSELGIDKAEEKVEKKNFAVKVGQIFSGRIDPEFNSPSNQTYQRAINSSKFDKVSISKLIDFVSGYAFKSTDYVEKGIPLLRIQNITEDGLVFESKKFLPTEYYEKYPRFRILEDDLVVSMTGGNDGDGRVGKISWNKENTQALLNQRCGIIRAKEEIEQGYLFSILSTKLLRDEMVKNAVVSVQVNISETDISTIQIPLPPLDIQNKIAAEVTVRRARAKELQIEARQILETAKDEFEQRICD